MGHMCLRPTSTCQAEVSFPVNFYNICNPFEKFVRHALTPLSLVFTRRVILLLLHVSHLEEPTAFVTGTGVLPRQIWDLGSSCQQQQEQGTNKNCSPVTRYLVPLSLQGGGNKICNPVVVILTPPRKQPANMYFYQ